MTQEYDPWYQCFSPGCSFATNSERNAENHELEEDHIVHRVDGFE